jgi:hypothetical protein
LQYFLEFWFKLEKYPKLINPEKNRNTSILGWRKIIEIHTQHTHYLKILSTPVYKNNSRMSIKNYFYPKLRKIRKAMKNNNQRMNIFFLEYLSYKEHRKNAEDPSSELIQG